jgi:adenylate cyclase
MPAWEAAPVVLETSRAGGIAHASVCGGRGRCSTCRIRITRGLSALPPPSPDERRVLDRVGAPPNVRLACHVRPLIVSEPVASRAALDVTALARHELTVRNRAEPVAIFVVNDVAQVRPSGVAPRSRAEEDSPA